MEKEKKKQTKSQKLQLSQTNKKFLGVCGGLAEYLNADPSLVRFFFVLLFFAPVPTLLIYGIMWFVIKD